jgi:hypothetical protein
MVGRPFASALLLGLACALLPAADSAVAQQKPGAAKSRQPAIRSDADARRVVRLVRHTFAAVHQANVSGNYSVFRDLAAPSLRSSMSLVRLGDYFKPLREAKADLSRALMTLPKFREKPVILRGKFLVLKGYIPGEPRLDFDFTYQRGGGRWRFVNIAIKPALAKPAANAPSGQEPESRKRASVRQSAPPPPTRRRKKKPESVSAPTTTSALRTTTISKKAASPDSPEEDDWPMRLWYSLPMTGGR